MMNSNYQEIKLKKTCSLIFFQTSKQIDKKFKDWKKNQPDRGSMVTIYSDTKLLGNVIRYHDKDNGVLKANNPNLLTIALAESLAENLDFNDSNEVYWGDPQTYFKDLLITSLIEIQEYNNYDSYWWDTPMSTIKDIKKFYQTYQTELVEDKDNYQSLLSLFIDFTYNTHEKLKLIENTIWEKEDITIGKGTLKNSSPLTLTFEKLNDKLLIFIHEIALPFIWGICFDRFNNLN